MAEDFIVTPWEVSGDVDYSQLIKDFGTQALSEAIRKRIEGHAGEHMFLRRGLFFSHRDMDIWMNEYEKGKPIALYTGRGPTGTTHVGHLMPWLFTKYLQDGFKADLYFQITDDEKYLFREDLTREKVAEYAYDNILDIIAAGFDPKKTHIFIDTEYAKTLYSIAIDVAKRVTGSTAKAVFGFSDSTNIGMHFFPAMQAAPCFLPSVLKGEPVRTLIPAAIDQDPYWRISRDVAPKLGYPKTAAIHSKFVPGLGRSGKMSASMPETCIFTTDQEDDVKKKVANTLTGGRDTVEEQKKLGGKPEECNVYKYHYYLFEGDDKKLNKRKKMCKNGELLCGECKADLVKYINTFLKEHQARREKAKNKVEDFLVRD